MSRSGVALHPSCISAYEDLKLGKNKSSKYIIYKMSDDKKSIVVDKIGTEIKYDVFIDDLPETDCRYAIYDFQYDTEDGVRQKLCFFTWSPDDAPVRSKMIYASSKDALRRALNGIHTEVQGTDFSEVAYETVLEKVSKGANKH